MNDKIRELEKTVAEYRAINEEQQMVLEALELVNRTDTLDDLLSALIDWMKRWSGCDSVGIRLRDGDDFPYYTTQRFSGQFVKLEGHLCSYDNEGKVRRDEAGNPLLGCMCGTVLCGRPLSSKGFLTADGCFWCASTTQLLAGITDGDGLDRICDQCNSFGYESVALIPLRLEKETFGLLQFNDHREGKFSPRMIASYRRVADHVSSFMAKMQARDALKRSEELFKAVVQNSADAIGVSGKGIHLFVNNAYLKMFGYQEPKELIGTPILELIAPGERDRIKSYGLARTKGEPVARHYQTKGLKKDGTVFDMRVEVSHYGSGDDQKSLVILRDETERNQAEKQLRTQKYFLEKAQELGKIGAWELDTRNDTLLWTEENYRIFGVPMGTKLTSKMFFASIHPDDREYVEKEWQAALAGKPYDLEHRIIADGVVKWVREKAAFEFNDQVECSHCIGVTQDITWMKQREAIQSAKLRLIDYATTHTSKELLQKFLDETEALTESEIGFFHLIDDDQDTVQSQTWSTNTLNNTCTMETQSEHYPLSKAGGWVECFLQRKPVVHNDYTRLLKKRNHLPKGHVPITRILTVPVIRSGNIVAILGVGNKKTIYTDQDVEFVQQLADMSWETLGLKEADEALHLSERRFRTLFEQAPIGIDLVSPDGIPILANQALIDLLGYPEEELFSQPFAVWTHPDDIKDNLEKIGRLREGKADHVAMEKRYIHKEGYTIWARTDVVAIRKNTGELDYFIAMVQDITRQKESQDALRKNEAALQQAQKLAGIGSWQWDLVSGQHSWSEEVYRIYGRSTNLPPAVYPEVQQYFTRESWAGLSEQVDKAIAKGKPYQYDAEVVRPDGKHRWVTARGEAVWDSGGQMIKLQGTVQDITERKQNEKALKESEERFRYLSEATVEGVHIHDQGIVLDANQAFAGMLGYDSVDEIIGRRILDKHLSPESLRKIQKLMASGDEGTYEIIGRTCNGVEFPVEIISRNIEYHGKPARVTATRDITQRKSAEKLLQWNVRRYELLSDTAARLLKSEDPNTILEDLCLEVMRFIDCQFFINYLEDHKEKKLHLNACAGITNEQRSEIEWLEYGTAVCGTVALTQQRLTFKDVQNTPNKLTELAKSFGIQAYCCHPLVIDGRLLGTLSFGRMSTPEFRPEEISVMEAVSSLVAIAVDRIESEKTRRNLEAQLRQAQKVEAIGRLAGGVSHDLNNLLSPVLGYSEMLLAEFGQKDERREMVEDIMEAGWRMRDLVRQLLAFSRKQVLQFKPLDINQAVEGMRKLLLRTIPEDIELNIVLSPEHHPVLADIGQFEQIIMNLTVNAADAMPKGGQLTIETFPCDINDSQSSIHPEFAPGRYMVLSVRDTGFGMDKDTFEHIFEPFFSTKGEQGTGLGLATVYGIIKQHNGYIWGYSEPGLGTTFRIYLPTVADIPLDKAPHRKAKPFLRGTETILLAEDNEQVRRLAAKVLMRQGYQVLEASNGAEALEILQSHAGTVDLLFTDVVMPGMNGKELYLQAVQHYPDLKVLYMSGYTDNVIVQRGVLEADVQFIQKPFANEVLFAKVRTVLDE